jgi:hypothetical protein
MMRLQDVQFGRELEEDEVLRINVILKRRATRYIAAVEEEWLYPERYASVTHWSRLDHDWFLFPHLYKVPFTSGMIVGYKGGGAWGMDEYGRQPGDPDFEDKELHDREWVRHLEARRAWARKREGKARAHVHKSGLDSVDDEFMAEDIARHSEECGRRH